MGLREANCSLKLKNWTGVRSIALLLEACSRLYFFIFIFKKIFIHLFWLLQVLVAAHGIFVVACRWELVP